MITLRKRTALLLLLIAPPAMAGNYATCLLDKLPGVANDVAANAVVQMCNTKYPGGFPTVGKGTGRGDWFGFKSGAECTAKKAADTRSNQAALQIGVACWHLYDDPASQVSKPGAIDGFLKDAPPYQPNGSDGKKPNYFDRYDN